MPKCQLQTNLYHLVHLKLSLVISLDSMVTTFSLQVIDYPVGQRYIRHRMWHLKQAMTAWYQLSRPLFATFGVPKKSSSDGGPKFISQMPLEFLQRWWVRHRKSSLHFPQSNGRAEVAVKKYKRLLMENISATGSLNNSDYWELFYKVETYQTLIAMCLLQ